MDPRLIPLIVFPAVILLIVLRNRRRRRLHETGLWILPAIIVPFIGLGLYFTPHAPFGIGAYAVFAGALALGAAAGWWRGKTVDIAREPDGSLSAQASPLGILLILGLLAARSGLRVLLEDHAAAWHLDVAVVTDAFLLFAVGLVVAQRAEMFLRARTLRRTGAPLAA